MLAEIPTSVACLHVCVVRLVNSDLEGQSTPTDYDFYAAAGAGRTLENRRRRRCRWQLKDVCHWDAVLPEKSLLKHRNKLDGDDQLSQISPILNDWRHTIFFIDDNHEHSNTCSCLSVSLGCPLSALTVLAGRQEVHPARNNLNSNPNPNKEW